MGRATAVAQVMFAAGWWGSLRVGDRGRDGLPTGSIRASGEAVGTTGSGSVDGGSALG